jgi:hypothetical protein
VDKPIIEGLQQSGKDEGLLSILKETPKDNLLAESMERKGATNFNAATEQSYQLLSDMRKKEESTSQKDSDDTEAQKPTLTHEEADETPAEDEKPEPIAATEEQSRWFALNEEQQRYSQRQEALERELLQERQRNSQVLEELRKTVPQAQESYDYDFTSPESIKAFEDRVYNRARNEFKQSQEPLMRNLAAKEFQNTINQLTTKHEHFNKYFSQQILGQYFQAAAQRFPVDQLLNLDWGKELSLAYKAADYDRLVQEAQKSSSGKDEEKKAEQKTKQDQKSNLKLVPKSNARSSSAKATITDELDEWRNGHSGRFGMEDISTQLKRKLQLG